MDKVAKYRQIIKKELAEQAKEGASDMPDIYNQLIISEDNNQFLLLVMGWHGKKYVHTVAYHLEIRDAKVWIHENRTDVDIAEALAQKGIAAGDIILGFTQPYHREVTFQ